MSCHASANVCLTNSCADYEQFFRQLTRSRAQFDIHAHQATPQLGNHSVKIRVCIAGATGWVGKSLSLANGMQVHALRLPGHSVGVEAIFGAPFERLRIPQEGGGGADPYIQGTLLTIRKVSGRVGLVRDLDQSWAFDQPVRRLRLPSDQVAARRAEPITATASTSTSASGSIRACTTTAAEAGKFGALK